MITTFVPQLGQKSITEFKRNLNIGCLVFIESEKQLLFQDANQKLHALKKVFFLEDTYNLEDGTKELPKPFIMDEAGNVKEYGDSLLYGYINDSDNNIVVFGSLQQITMDMFDKLLNYKLDDLKDLAKFSRVRNNKVRYYSIHEDSEGNFYFNIEGKEGEKKGKGNLFIKVRGTDGNGNVKLETNGLIALNQVKKDGENEKVIAQILIDNKNETIKIHDQFKNVILCSKEGIVIKSKEVVKIESEKDVIANIKGNLQAKADGEAIVESPKATIKSKDAKVTGGAFTVRGSSTPNGQGSFCAVPQCIFSGAPHTSDNIQGT